MLPQRVLFIFPESETHSQAAVCWVFGVGLRRVRHRRLSQFSATSVRGVPTGVFTCTVQREKKWLQGDELTVLEEPFGKARIQTQGWAQYRLCHRPLRRWGWILVSE